MKLFITFMLLMVIALCYWVCSYDSCYWLMRKNKDLNVNFFSICLIIAITCFLSVWLI